MKYIYIVIILVLVLSLLLLYIHYKNKKPVEITKIQKVPTYVNKIVNHDVIKEIPVIQERIVDHYQNVYASYEDSIINYCNSQDYIDDVKVEKDKLDILNNEITELINIGPLQPFQTARKNELQFNLIPAQLTAWNKVKSRCNGFV